MLNFKSIHLLHLFISTLFLSLSIFILLLSLTFQPFTMQRAQMSPSIWLPYKQIYCSFASQIRNTVRVNLLNVALQWNRRSLLRVCARSSVLCWKWVHAIGSLHELYCIIRSATRMSNWQLRNSIMWYVKSMANWLVNVPCDIWEDIINIYFMLPKKHWKIVYIWLDGRIQLWLI